MKRASREAEGVVVPVTGSIESGSVSAPGVVHEASDPKQSVAQHQAGCSCHAACAGGICATEPVMAKGADGGLWHVDRACVLLPEAVQRLKARA
jgi:hypothetical protein